MTYAELFLEIKDRKDWRVSSNNKHELQWTCFLFEGKLFVLFQESNGKLDWRDNFNIMQKKVTCANGKVVMSDGINLAYKTGREEIRAALSVFDLQKTPVIVSGWSHGGGVAVRCAVDLNHTFGIFPSVVTFGAPAVLWGEESKRHVQGCCAGVLQFAHVNDIVTHVAPMAYHINRVDLTYGRIPLFGNLNPWHYHTKYDKWCTEGGWTRVV